jgi:hypothetical protein
MTKDKGRGVFVTKNLRKGHLICVEKALVDAVQDDKQGILTFIDPVTMLDSTHSDLVKACSDLASLKGLEALKLTYMNHGTENHQIPPMSIFGNNNYKMYHPIEDISIDRIGKIVKLNCLEYK